MTIISALTRTRKPAIHILVLLLCLSLSSAAVSFAQVRLIHNPVFFAKENEPIEMSVRVEGGVSSSAEMRLYYHLQGEESYQYILMQNVGDEFRGEIPAQSMNTARIQYFLTMVQNENIVTLPETNPYYEPFEIQITPATSTQENVPTASRKLASATAGQPALGSGKYLILSPEEGQKLEPGELVIAISLFFSADEIDVYKTRLLLDGRQVKPELSSELITYVPPRIGEGEHEVDLYFVRPDGSGFQPVRWRFQVASEAKSGMRKMPLIAGSAGNIFAESKVEKYSGNKLENNQLGGQLRGKQGPLRYGTSFYVTSQEDKQYQPRNRFLFWLDLNLIKLYAGDTSPNISELILNGKRVRGFDAQLNLKFINFDFVMGQTYRPVEGRTIEDYLLDPATQDTLFYNPATQDTVTFNTGVYLKQKSVQGYGTYGQNLMALRTSFGGGQHFQWGLNLLKVKDDVKSIQYGLKPKDNLVLGTDLLFAMFNNRFRWKSEVAFSLLTDDISTGPLSKADIDSIMNSDVPIDPADYEKYLVLNTSTIPLDPSKLSSLAYLSTLQLKLLRNTITVKYKSIGSAYNSLGNTFIKKNIRGLLVNDQIRLWQNRIYLSLGYEDYEDNFLADDNNPTIALQTLQYGLNFFPGGGFPNMNLNHRSYRRNNNISDLTGNPPADEREDNTTDELTLNLNYDFTLFNLNHNLSLNYITLDKTDAFVATRTLTTLPIGINNNIQSFMWQTKFRIPLKTSISYASNENSYLGGLNIFKFNSLDLRADYNMFQNRLTCYGTFRSFNASGGTNPSLPGGALLGTFKIDYAKSQLDFGSRFSISQRQYLLLDVSWINFKDKGGYIDGTGNFVTNPSFKDYSFRFRYEFQF